ncbi:MAG: hypothetical protein M3Q03_03650 [Chloroflexota bacterium]|nr:hypothetical protein [Chloroflexota bacterium]
MSLNADQISRSIDMTDQERLDAIRDRITELEQMPEPHPIEVFEELVNLGMLECVYGR